MDRYPKPQLVVSKCLGFADCRWNGIAISSTVVEKLEPFVTFHPVCPEMEIGLGVPRKPIRIVLKKERRLLLQSINEMDVTERMERFCSQFLDGLTGKPLDGFILKGRSPSCGIKDVKLYPRLGKVAALSGKAKGFFGSAVLKRFPLLAVEDEGRLTSFQIREHFLTQVFALARLREFLEHPTPAGLVEFQARHKLLLMGYNQSKMRELGRIVANHEQHPFDRVCSAFADGFRLAISKAPRTRSNVNVLMHALGHFSEGLGAPEKAHFLGELERFRAGHTPLSVPIGIIRSFIARFGNDYLAKQYYFDPYPESLVEITDSGKGRSW